MPTAKQIERLIRRHEEERTARRVSLTEAVRAELEKLAEVVGEALAEMRADELALFLGRKKTEVLRWRKGSKNDEDTGEEADDGDVVSAGPAVDDAVAGAAETVPKRQRETGPAATPASSPVSEWPEAG